jgi:hypothetical protein
LFSKKYLNPSLLKFNTKKLYLMPKQVFLTLFSLLLCTIVFCQDENQKLDSIIEGSLDSIVSYKIFNNTRLVNSHSTEILRPKTTNLMLAQRFGAFKTLNDLDGINKITDLFVGLEYGINKSITLGINGSRGAGPLKNNINGLFKTRLISESKKKPLSIALLVSGSISTMTKDNTKGSITNFENFFHRVSYFNEIMFAKKLGSFASLLVSTDISYRNLVSSVEDNYLLSGGLGTEVFFSKSLSLILDAKKPISQNRKELGNIPLGAGLQWASKDGFVLQLNVCNNAGIVETDVLPYTASDPRDGQLNLGFRLSKIMK